MTPSSLILFLILLVAWELAWKGFALWRSAQRKQKVWFVALLLINSAGILPIIYLIHHGDILRSKTR